MGLKESFTREKASEDPLGYDDAASYYFGCCVIFCIVVPWTFFLARRFFAKSSPEIATAAAIECRCSLCAKAVQERQKNTKPTSKFGKLILVQLLVIILLWAYLGLTLWQLSGRDFISTFDPYEVLGLSRYATIKDIRKAYRTLSLRLHPDRNPDDASAAAQFILISKAYKTLTDDGARKNYELYGNPDGPGVMKVGIGLPKFLVEKDNHIWILLLFTLILIFIIPSIFIFYHRRSNKFAPNGLRYETVQMLGQMTARDLKIRHLLELVAASAEAREIPAAEDNSEVPTDLLKAKEKRLFSDNPLITRNLTLLVAQTQGKRDLLSPSSQLQLDEMLRHVDLIAMTIVEIAAYHKWGALHTTVVLMLRELVQAKPVSTPLLSLLQIPHFDNSIINSIAKGRHAVRDLREFLNLPPAKRKGLETLTPEQLTDVEEFCQRVPRITLHADVHVEGEAEIAEEDVLTIRVTLTRENLEAGQIAGNVHCPFWPQQRKERWLIFVTELHTGSPIAFMETTSPEKTVTIETLRPAPQKGKHGVRIQAMSDSYAGVDAQTIVEFKVVTQLDARRRIEVHPADLALDEAPSLVQHLMGLKSNPRDEEEDASYVKAG